MTTWPATTAAWLRAPIDAAYQEWLATSWDETSVLCEDWTFYGDGFSYDWAKLYWSGSLTDGEGLGLLEDLLLEHGAVPQQRDAEHVLVGVELA